MKAMIAATLMDENQNSNSPKLRVERRLDAVSKTVRTRPVTQVGMSGSQGLMMLAPAIASKATTITQKYQ